MEAITLLLAYTTIVTGWLAFDAWLGGTADPAMRRLKVALCFGELSLLLAWCEEPTE